MEILGKGDPRQDLPDFENFLNKTTDSNSERPKMPGGITIILGPGMNNQNSPYQ